MDITPEKISQLRELYPTGWVKKYGIKNEAGFPIEFHNHKFLYDIYNDLSPLQVLLKPPQIGATVMQTLKSLYVAKKLNKQIIYTLPTEKDVQDMVGGSINRIIAQNPILMQWVKDHDTVEQKSVGDSIIFYRGTFTAKQAMMIPSDLNIHDEVDASDADVITHYENRLQAKADGMRWYFSHPSLAGHGVDIYWQQSDQKEWHIKCPHCGLLQVLTWPQNIHMGRGEYICSNCSRTLADNDRRNGTWKPTAAGKFSGYHISQLMCPWISASKIIEAYQDPMKDKQYFYNYVLGLPYIGSDDTIDAKTVLKNCIDEVNDQTSTVIIGVDTGLPIHFTLMNQDGVFFYGTCEPETEAEKTNPHYDPYDKLRGFLTRFKKSVLVSDQGGDLIGIRKLQAEYPGRVFLCYYQKDKKSNEVIRWGTKEEYGIVKVDRNRMIQLIVEQLREPGRIRINGLPEEWSEWAAHWGNMYREKVVVKETPDKDNRSLYGNEYIWKRRGPDHYCHSHLYAMVGLDRYGKALARIVGEDPFEGIATGRIVQTYSPQTDPKTYRAATVVQGFSPDDFKGGSVEL